MHSLLRSVIGRVSWGGHLRGTPWRCQGRAGARWLTVRTPIIAGGHGLAALIRHYNHATHNITFTTTRGSVSGRQGDVRARLPHPRLRGGLRAHRARGAFGLRRLVGPGAHPVTAAQHFSLRHDVPCNCHDRDVHREHCGVEPGHDGAPGEAAVVPDAARAVRGDRAGDRRVRAYTRYA